jgi:hypothetical protein
MSSDPPVPPDTQEEVGLVKLVLATKAVRHELNEVEALTDYSPRGVDEICESVAREALTAAGIPDLENALSAARQERDEAEARELTVRKAWAKNVEQTRVEYRKAMNERVAEVEAASRDREGRLEEAAARMNRVRIDARDGAVEFERKRAEGFERALESAVADVERLLASRDVEGRLRAKNGEPCDCETPGDWHRVANDFQRAMFEERRQARFAVIERDALEGAIKAALRTLDTMGLEGGEVCRGLRAALADVPTPQRALAPSKTEED